MNWADYALLTILLVSMGIGLWRGFIVEVLSLTVWVAAFWLTIGFGADVAGRLDGIASPSGRQFVGHAGVFLAVLVGGGLLVWAIGRVISRSGLSATDRVLGIGFGLARGLLLVCVAVLLLGFTPVPQEGWWAQSRLLPQAERGAGWMMGFLPSDASRLLDFGSGGAGGDPLPAGGPLPAANSPPADEPAGAPVPEN